MNKTPCLWLLLALFAISNTVAAENAAAEYDCILEPHQTVNVGSASDGVLEKVLVDRGDNVEKGQLLARLTTGVEEASI